MEKGVSLQAEAPLTLCTAVAAETLQLTAGPVTTQKTVNSKKQTPISDGFGDCMPEILPHILGLVYTSKHPIV
jgi:hypothetical protein